VNTQADIEDYLSFTISEDDRTQYKRLDQFLAEKAQGHSRTFLKNLFLKDQIVVSDESPLQPKLELKKCHQLELL